jgi:hypothetical protein
MQKMSFVNSLAEIGCACREHASENKKPLIPE